VIPPRLRPALERRAPLFASPDTDAFRLVHRAADGFPDLAVDRFADVLVAHLYHAGAIGPAPVQLLRDLAGHVGARAVFVKHRPTQASILSEAERAALAPRAPLLGEPVESVVVREGGLKFLVRPGEGLNPGLFLDMRETRAWVRAHALRRTVLNCFAYTCGFGLAAIAGGAARAVNVDLSRRHLDWGRRNYELNGFTPGARDFIAGDVFDWLRRLARRGQVFDLVILDPPSFATTKRSRFSVRRDYAGLAALALKVVAPGGWLVACANAAELPRRSFLKELRAGLDAASTAYPARITHATHEPGLDFPVAQGEDPYLKIAFVAVTAAGGR
jgi:23S rRNA (cytosine1962-C5)-methyltransferase